MAALAAAAQPALAERPAGPPVRLAAGPAAFPAGVLSAVAARTGCRVQIVPPLAPGAVPAAGADLVELRGDDAGALVASGRLELIDEATVAGLNDVPGRLRDLMRDAGGGLRAVPYLWSPQLLLARRSVYGTAPPTSLRALFSLRGAARGALPDSPLVLALAARYLGVGDPFALDRDELAAARQVVAPARPLLHLYSGAAALRSLFRRGVIDLALGNPATLGDQRGSIVAGLPSEGTIASERVLGVVAGTRRAICARRVAGGLLAPAAQARLAAVRGLLPVRAATCTALSEAACTALRRALSQTLANSSMALHPAASAGVTGWPEWVGEWVLLRG
ncbi:MAG: putative spermidine/putrescine transport system substrate-binding protein [Gaiellales bacterium]|nr:putative spermidine/putrescine transport system substrate-binding protein [Gaiellales bacterium]